MMTDFRFALRQLFKSPGFTLLAVITLALGIGLNTAILGLINDLFLGGLPFSEPDRVWNSRSFSLNTSFRDLRHLSCSLYRRNIDA